MGYEICIAFQHKKTSILMLVFVLLLMPEIKDEKIMNFNRYETHI